jgi:AcrR family transcriptional regulator
MRAQKTSRAKPGRRRVASARPAARRRMTAAERERQILDAAVRFFAEVGFAGQTRELAQRLGITQPLLYRYFPTKQDLIERVFEEIYLKRIDPAWRRQLVDRAVPLRERLRVFYLSYAAATYRYEWIRIYMFSGLMGEALNRRYIQVVEDKILRPICAELRHHCGLPERTATDLDLEQAWIMHGSLFYCAVRKHVYHSRVAEDFAAVVGQTVDVVLEGLKALARRNG